MLKLLDLALIQALPIFLLFKHTDTGLDVLVLALLFPEGARAVVLGFSILGLSMFTHYFRSFMLVTGGLAIFAGTIAISINPQSET